MSTDHEASSAPHLSAGERALLAALIEFPETTASGIADVTRLSSGAARRALRRFESLGAAVRASPPSIDGSPVADLWSASSTVLNFLAVPNDGTIPGVDRPTTRDKILTAVGLRPGLPVGELAWCTALSRPSTTEMLAVLEQQGLVHRVARTGRSGGRIADGWALTQADPSEPLFDLAADGDEA